MSSHPFSEAQGGAKGPYYVSRGAAWRLPLAWGKKMLMQRTSSLGFFLLFSATGGGKFPFLSPQGCHYILVDELVSSFCCSSGGDPCADVSDWAHLLLHHLDRATVRPNLPGAWAGCDHPNGIKTGPLCVWVTLGSKLNSLEGTCVWKRPRCRSWWWRDCCECVSWGNLKKQRGEMKPFSPLICSICFASWKSSF